jgi:hypothetical protein
MKIENVWPLPNLACIGISSCSTTPLQVDFGGLPNNWAGKQPRLTPTANTSARQYSLISYAFSCCLLLVLQHDAAAG